MPNSRKTLKPIPLYVATKSLKVHYSFVSGEYENATWESPEAVDTHAKLKAGVQGLLDTREGLVHKTGRKIYNKEFKAGNVATASVTLLYTDTDAEEGYLGADVEHITYDIPSLVSNKRIVSVLDYYDAPYKQKGVVANKAGRSKLFMERLANRIDSFGRINLNYDLNLCVPTVAALKEEVAGTQFHEHFHHSEQAFATLLSSSLGVEFLAASARSNKAAYVYGMVLDLYTQRLVCRNCNVSLLGMQNSDSKGGFLHDFRIELSKPKNRIKVSECLMLHTRVTADSTGTGTSMDAINKLVDDKEVVHKYNPSKDCYLLQTSAKSIGVAKKIKDNNYGINSYNGAFFTAINLAKTNKHLENSIVIKP
jgi:hypothetical protein